METKQIFGLIRSNYQTLLGGVHEDGATPYEEAFRARAGTNVGRSKLMKEN